MRARIKKAVAHLWAAGMQETKVCGSCGAPNWKAASSCGSCGAAV